jgi:hypothetical protein
VPKLVVPPPVVVVLSVVPVEAAHSQRAARGQRTEVPAVMTVVRALASVIDTLPAGAAAVSVL